MNWSPSEAAQWEEGANQIEVTEEEASWAEMTSEEDEIQTNPQIPLDRPGWGRGWCQSI